MCYLTSTTPETHAVIRANLDRSPRFSGFSPRGGSPAYCPSIEDKVVRFAGKERHLLFIEPMGLDTEELYIQGFSILPARGGPNQNAPHHPPAWSRRR